MSPTMIGLVLMIILSSIIGWFFSRSKTAETPVKVMLFVLYFWGSAFVQLIIFAVLYQFELMTFLN